NLSIKYPRAEKITKHNIKTPKKANASRKISVSTYEVSIGEKLLLNFAASENAAPQPSNDRMIFKKPYMTPTSPGINKVTNITMSIISNFHLQ
ncbi:MAG: hypothetical protein ACI9XC_002430, partial [Gammaproteobacteria bacterium]